MIKKIKRLIKNNNKKDYQNQFKTIRLMFFSFNVLLAAMLGLFWTKTSGANLTKMSLLVFVVIIFCLKYWVLIDMFRLNKAKYNKDNNEEVKKTTPWSYFYYRYILWFSLLLLFILSLVDVSDYKNNYDWLMFTLCLILFLIGTQRILIMEIKFKKIYNLRFPIDLFVVK